MYAGVESLEDVWIFHLEKMEFSDGELLWPYYFWPKEWIWIHHPAGIFDYDLSIQEFHEYLNEATAPHLFIGTIQTKDK